MSDHGAGPRATASPEIDICDLFAFPSPERPGYLVVIMNVFPFMPTMTTLFSDAIDYRLRLRPVTIAATGPGAAFAVADHEQAYSFTFSVPDKAATGQPAQQGTCQGPSARVSFRVGDEGGADSKTCRVFAGWRLDPFFVDQFFSGGIRLDRRLPDKLTGVNSVAGQNVLSIVLEIECAALVGPGAGPLVAIVAETTTNGSFRARQDRVGRPEIKNFIMMDKDSDTVNRDLDVRDLYSEEDGFKLRPDYLGAYRARLNSNMRFYDSLDGKIDWPLDAQGNHPLTEMLLADFLVVDTSKPFDENGYLEIERAMLRGDQHRTCGGRWLNHDIVDSLLTILVNNGNGPRISDGVDGTTEPATFTFPYLAPPNPVPPPLAPLVGIPT